MEGNEIHAEMVRKKLVSRLALITMEDSGKICKVAIVMPFKDEELRLEVAVSSLLSQSVAPEAIILVDDGSEDSSFEVAADLASKHECIYVIKSGRTGLRESGSGIINAVIKGISQLVIDEYDYIAKFDCDLQFPERYLEIIFSAFNDDKNLGLAGGVCSIYDEDLKSWTLEQLTNDDHVRGALKCYSVKAFKAMNGFANGIGWDTIDEFRLRYLGYNVLCVDSLQVKQFRETNAETPKRKMAFKIGRSLFNMRTTLFVAAVSISKRARILGGDMPTISMLKGYFQPKIAGEPPLVSVEVGNYINTYRKAEFGKKLRKILPFSSSGRDL